MKETKNMNVVRNISFEVTAWLFAIECTLVYLFEKTVKAATPIPAKWYVFITSIGILALIGCIMMVISYYESIIEAKAVFILKMAKSFIGSMAAFLAFTFLYEMNNAVNKVIGIAFLVPVIVVLFFFRIVSNYIKLFDANHESIKGINKPTSVTDGKSEEGK